MKLLKKISTVSIASLFALLALAFLGLNGLRFLGQFFGRSIQKPVHPRVADLVLGIEPNA